MYSFFNVHAFGHRAIFSGKMVTINLKITIMPSKDEGKENVESRAQQRKARGKDIFMRWEKETAAVIISDKIKRKQMKRIIGVLRRRWESNT